MDPTKYPAIHSQPSSFGVMAGQDSNLYEPKDGVTIRLLHDTEEDAQFAGELTIEAFRGKFAHNVTERK